MKDGADLVKLGDQVLPQNKWIYDSRSPKRTASRIRTYGPTRHMPSSTPR